jgi:hypothetical protein
MATPSCGTLVRWWSLAAPAARPAASPRWSSQMACAVPSPSTASDGHPRSPAAVPPWRATGASNVLPPSRDRAIAIAVTAARAVHSTTTSGSAAPVCRTSATRGGSSPPSRASPAVAFTRTGAPKVAPLSRLVARKTSVLPSAVAPQATATNAPALATDGVWLVRPSTASETTGGGVDRTAATTGAATSRVTDARTRNRRVNIDALQSNLPECILLIS